MLGKLFNVKQTKSNVLCCMAAVFDLELYSYAETTRLIDSVAEGEMSKIIAFKLRWEKKCWIQKVIATLWSAFSWIWKSRNRELFNVFWNVVTCSPKIKSTLKFYNIGRCVELLIIQVGFEQCKEVWSYLKGDHHYLNISGD